MKQGKNIRESLLSKDHKVSQGYVDIKNKTVEELEELIERQDKLLKNRSFIAKLPDKGEKIISFKTTLESELKKRQEEYLSTCQLLKNLTLTDEISEELEWNKGKPSKKNEELDSDDDESDGEMNPLKLIASHSGTAKGKITKLPSSTDTLKNHYVEKFCEKYGQAKKPNERFKPNQLKDNNKNLFAISAENVKKRLGDKWEVTQATPPIPVFNDTVIISLSESLELQKKQAEKLQELETQHATERLIKSLSIKIGDKVPVNNIHEYRSSKNVFYESPEDENGEEEGGGGGGNDSEEDDGKAVCYSVDNELPES